MRKRIIAIALCLVMVSAFAVTGAVSGSKPGQYNAGQSNIRQYNVYWGWSPTYAGYGPAPVGKATLDVATGHLVVNVNINKVRAEDPRWEESWPVWIMMVNGWTFADGTYVYLYQDNSMPVSADGTATLDIFIDPGLIPSWSGDSNVWMAAY